MWRGSCPVLIPTTATRPSKQSFVFSLFHHGRGRGRAVAAVLALAAAGGVVVFAEDAPSSPPVASGAQEISASGAGTTPNGAAAAAANTTANPDLAPNELADLEGFLRLAPERITQLRKALDYLDSMTPLQRDALLRDVQSRQNLIRQLHQEISGDLQPLAQSDRSILGRYEVTLFPEALQTLIKRFQDAGADAAARKAIIQEMLKDAADKGILAAPPNPPGNGARGNSTNGGRGRTPTNNGRNPRPPASAASTAPASTTTSP